MQPVACAQYVLHLTHYKPAKNEAEDRGKRQKVYFQFPAFCPKIDRCRIGTQLYHCGLQYELSFVSIASVEKQGVILNSARLKIATFG